MRLCHAAKHLSALEYSTKTLSDANGNRYRNWRYVAEARWVKGGEGD
jgi:hypothetical protein